MRQAQEKGEPKRSEEIYQDAGVAPVAGRGDYRAHFVVTSLARFNSITVLNLLVPSAVGTVNVIGNSYTVAAPVPAAGIPVALSSVAFTENVSVRGARVVTKQHWKPEERVLLKSLESDFQSQARVMYCQHLTKSVFAVGLDLISPAGEWGKPC